ncbi:transposase [Pyrenophora seminiperda CCB06]|uniref:Transposase n=1 Tax=Pyrenophora seminiperda CCB06 TaxID=1302712 RepID=A0A3M7M7E4_9PLEO|nr:transposase [Pyrenophora seminiperda CCB06]
MARFYSSIRTRPCFTKHYNTAYEDVEPNLANIKSAEELNSVVINWILEAEERYHNGPLLLKWFTEFTKDWNMDTFTAVNKEIKMALRNFLNVRGIYLKSPLQTGETLAGQLYELTNDGILPEWPEEDLKSMLMFEDFLYNRDNYKSATPPGSPPQRKPTPPPPPPPTAPQL